MIQLKGVPRGETVFRGVNLITGIDKNFSIKPADIGIVFNHEKPLPIVFVGAFLHFGLSFGFLERGKISL
jgi:hypothetical protein